ncbi:MAG: hypothetical protein JST11_27290 [Acidobacteria bacterium]|nr:hypothetical protein [Acidobacteriota bacterium]
MKWAIVLTLGLVVSAVAADRIPAADPAGDDSSLRQLLTVRRIYVDRLTGGETAAQMRDILMATIQGSGLFVLTENQDRADAVLRGAAEDLVFSEVHSTSDGINARVNAGTGRSSSRSTASYGGLGIGETESEHSTERRHEAIAAVRLVNKEGDVIWATTQESLGGKFHGASADVAEKITSRLKEDYEKARKLSTQSRIAEPRATSANESQR